MKKFGGKNESSDNWRHAGSHNMVPETTLCTQKCYNDTNEV